jgi:hypothetical protein
MNQLSDAGCPHIFPFFQGWGGEEVDLWNALVSAPCPLAIARRTCYNVLKEQEMRRTEEFSELGVLSYSKVIINTVQENMHA